MIQNCLIQNVLTGTNNVYVLTKVVKDLNDGSNTVKVVSYVEARSSISFCSVVLASFPGCHAWANCNTYLYLCVPGIKNLVNSNCLTLVEVVIVFRHLHSKLSLAFLVAV